MDSHEIEARVLRELERLSGGRPVTPATDLVVELSLDSLQVMEMLMDLEDALDLSIPVNILAEVRTAGELARAVSALRVP